MAQNWGQVAKEILESVGGQSNVRTVENCMTRLRLGLVSQDKVNKEKLKAIDGVMGVIEAEGQLQVVIGPGKVNKVKAEFEKLMENSNSNKSEDTLEEAKKLKDEIKKKNATPFKLALKSISNIFIPLIPAFIACGLVTAILNIILKIDPSLGNSSFIALLKVAGNSVFWGLNLFVGVSAAKEFGASPMLGGVMAAVISHPSLSDISLFGQNLVPGRGGIVAVLLVVAFSSWLEKKLRKIVPDTLDLFLTPLLVILISTFVAVYALQPVGGIISEGIGEATKIAIEKGGMVTGFVLGGAFLPLVMTGLHQGLTPIHAELLSSTGVTILLPILAMAGAGQVGASIAVYRMTKNKRIKKTISSSLLVGIMGVGEPLIYGVTLPLGKPFIGACIGGAFGGAIQAFFHVGATAMGLSGLPLAATTNNPLMFIVGALVAYGAGYIATRLLGFDDPAE